jgi:hypothetical protein
MPEFVDQGSDDLLSRILPLLQQGDAPTAAKALQRFVESLSPGDRPQVTQALGVLLAERGDVPLCPPGLSAAYRLR